MFLKPAGEGRGRPVSEGAGLYLLPVESTSSDQGTRRRILPTERGIRLLA
jgi:hypothetical protein